MIDVFYGRSINYYNRDIGEGAGKYGMGQGYDGGYSAQCNSDDDEGNGWSDVTDENGSGWGESSEKDVKKLDALVTLAWAVIE